MVCWFGVFSTPLHQEGSKNGTKEPLRVEMWCQQMLTPTCSMLRIDWLVTPAVPLERRGVPLMLPFAGLKIHCWGLFTGRCAKLRRFSVHRAQAARWEKRPDREVTPAEPVVCETHSGLMFLEVVSWFGSHMRSCVQEETISPPLLKSSCLGLRSCKTMK